MDTRRGRSAFFKDVGPEKIFMLDGHTVTHIEATLKWTQWALSRQAERKKQKQRYTQRETQGQRETKREYMKLGGRSC